MSIAIAHWGEHCDGGGERLAWELARTFNTELWVGSSDDGIGAPDVTTRELFGGRWARRAIELGGLPRMVAYRLLWERDVAPLRQADTVITSGQEPLFYVPDGEQTWVAYVHHTGRQQTDLLAERFGTGLKGRLAQGLMAVQRWQMAAQSSKPDLIVANSEPVARRIHRYWGVPMDEITVVYPPVATADYSRHDAETGDYYLTLSRLDWHKRLAPVVRTASELGLPLKVAGGGQDRERLERLAGPTVEILGYVSEDRKRELCAGARAVINNALAEDFGLTTVEPMAAGTPVIGVAEGMTQYLVQDGHTGISYDRGELAAALRTFEGRQDEFEPAEIENFAQRFDVAQFREGMQTAVEQARTHASAEHRPEWAQRTEQSEPMVADGGKQ